MSREKLYSSKSLDIEFDSQGQFLYANWKGFQNVDSIKDGGEKLLRFLVAKKVSSILNDNRLVTGPWQGAAEWVAKEWFPRMFAAGMKRFAWVQSQNVFSQLSADKTLSETEMSQKNEGIRIFNNLEQAQQWAVTGNA
jgi:hypothetical protein